jgi:site-specific DNA recombinase
VLDQPCSKAPAVLRCIGRRRALRNGPLAHILRNRVYRGAINHKGQSHPGEHEPIVERALFEAVQAKLDEQRRGKRRSRTSSEALLLGRIFDDRGNRMTPSHAVKNGARYRYYATCVLAQGRKHEAGSVPRVAAPEIEAIVLKALRQADEGGRRKGPERAQDRP